MSSAYVDSHGTLGLRAWTTQGGSSMSVAHRHQDLELNYLLQGTMRYLIGGTFVTLPLHQLCVIWGTMPHQSVSSDPAREMMLVTLPLAHAMFWNLPQEFIRQLLGRGIVIDPKPNLSDCYLMQEWQLDLQSGQENRRQLILSELAARLHRMALNVIEVDVEPSTQHPCETHSGEALQLTGKMAELISQNFQEPLSANQIARHVNLHPNYAMTLFRQQTGMTLNTYLTRQRVAHAQRLLVTTPMAILEVAQESGFQSVSRFYEAFKHESRCTPRQFRQQMTPNRR
jgi:AraC-like DNA-binding protein